MKVKVNKRALKDLAAIPSRDREKIETFLFTELEAFHSIADIGGMEKLTGYDVFYRKRFGHYRMGVRYENGELTVERILHRKDIYGFFP